MPKVEVNLESSQALYRSYLATLCSKTPIFLISDLGVHKYVARRIHPLEVERSRMACVVRLSGPDANEGLQLISPNVAKVRMEYC